MIRFFQTPQKSVIATEVDHVLSEQEIKELNWLYGHAIRCRAAGGQLCWSTPRDGNTMEYKCR